MTGKGHLPDGSDGAAPGPYRRGWRAPWRGQWGPMADPHSRLGRLAKRITEDLNMEYDDTRPVAALLIRRAARLLALSESTLDQVGTDPKASRRAASALAAAADRSLDRLERLGAKRERPTPTILDLLQADQALNGPVAGPPS